MPGVFAVEDGEIVWTHDPARAADQPDVTTIASLIADAR